MNPCLSRGPCLRPVLAHTMVPLSTARLRPAPPQLRGRRNEGYGRAYTGASIHDFHESLSEHDAIIAALRTGDADAAEQATARNWRNGAERYHHVVELHGDKGSW